MAPPMAPTLTAQPNPLGGVAPSAPPPRGKNLAMQFFCQLGDCNPRAATPRPDMACLGCCKKQLSEGTHFPLQIRSGVKEGSVMHLGDGEIVFLKKITKDEHGMWNTKIRDGFQLGLACRTKQENDRAVVRGGLGPMRAIPRSGGGEGPEWVQ